MNDPNIPNKVYAVLTSKQEAEIIRGLLEANEIPAMIRGAKEYASIITGGDLGRFEILIPSNKFLEAHAIFPRDKIDDSPRVEKIRNHKEELRRSIIFAFIGIAFLPIVFNVLSLLSLREYIRKAPSNKFKPTIIALCIIMNFAPIIWLFYFFR